MKNYYDTCTRCGANLDPGEECDCQEKKVYEYEIEANGQLKLAV